MLWCQHQLQQREDFQNVIFADESSVQLETHAKLCFRKRKTPRKLKPRAKHPVKIHVWGGISHCGATKIIMFSGIMNAERLGRILEVGLLPFIRDKFPHNHRLYHDNDPKHASNHIKNFFSRNNVTWWPTPPESPDLNPIELVWGSMKQYLCQTYKPRNLADLKNGIQLFWNTLTPEVCQKYISHLKKVVPKVIEVNGEASGY